MSGQLNIHAFSKPFVTESGFRLEKPVVAYRSWGSLNERHDNVILICHALTGDAAADEWFHGFFGTDKLFDPEKQFILCANVPGSCYGSTGPLSINPENGNPYAGNFPMITIRDQVRYQQILLDDLDINGIQLVVGGSMGGMQALEFAVMDKRVESAILIGMGKAHSPWAIGISEAQRQAIYSDPNWKNGFYPPDSPPQKGLAIARMIAMISYRTASSFDNRFGRNLQKESGQFQVESYLNYQGDKLVERFDAVSYVRLTQTMDSHDVSRDRGTFAEVLGKIDIPVLVVGVDTDILYPVAEQKELASLLGNAKYVEVESEHGHDAFLIEFDQMLHLFTPFLKRTSTRSTLTG